MNIIEIPETVFNKWVNNSNYIENKFNEILANNNLTLFMNEEFAFNSFTVLHKGQFVMDCQKISIEGISSLPENKLLYAFYVRISARRKGKMLLAPVIITGEVDETNHFGFGCDWDLDSEAWKGINPDNRNHQGILQFTFLKALTMFYDVQKWSMNYRKEIIKISSEAIKREKKSSNSSNNSSRKIVMKSGVIYSRTYDNEDVRPYTRHIEAWEVKGHYRHYKNGKTVYIKPYQKGEGEINEKKYVILV